MTVVGNRKNAKNTDKEICYRNQIDCKDLIIGA